MVCQNQKEISKCDKTNSSHPDPYPRIVQLRQVCWPGPAQSRDWEASENKREKIHRVSRHRRQVAGPEELEKCSEGAEEKEKFLRGRDQHQHPV